MARHAWVEAPSSSYGGSAGDPIVELKHLKQPGGEIGPLKIEHDRNTGQSTVYRGQVDPLAILEHGSDGLDAAGLARLIFECEKPSDNQRKKAQRHLGRLVQDGIAHRKRIQPRRRRRLSRRSLLPR